MFLQLNLALVVAMHSSYKFVLSVFIPQLTMFIFFDLWFIWLQQVPIETS